MTTFPRVYILGCGAVGLALAACLACAGREVIGVRTSTSDAAKHTRAVTMHMPEGEVTASLDCLSLSQLTTLEGLVVVTTKAHANSALSSRLAQMKITAPLVVLQNGLGVEAPFLGLPCDEIYRCVLYMSAQVAAENEVTFRSIAPCPVGVIKGQGTSLHACVQALTTAEFPFRVEEDIQRVIWKKAIANAVFNSICPLLTVDNGIFARDREATTLAEEIVAECLALARSEGVLLESADVMEQILNISRGSQGTLISTLQDINAGRETEMEWLNLEMARRAAAANPPIDFTRTELLGRLVLAKAKSARCRQTA